MLNTKYLIFIFVHILISNQFGYSQQISYLEPSKGNKIYKYRINIDNVVGIIDSTLLAEYSFNSAGFCVDNDQFESNSKTRYFYKDDTILISSNFYGGSMDNYSLNSETLNFFNPKNQLIKTEIKLSGHVHTIIEYKYDGKHRNIKDIIKSSNKKTIGKKKRFYNGNLLIMEEYWHKDGNYKSYTHFNYNVKGQISELYHGRTKNEKTLIAKYHYQPNGIIIKNDVNSCEDILSETIYDAKMNILSEKKYQNGRLISLIKYHYVYF
jgi:hypothetical protein